MWIPKFRYPATSGTVLTLTRPMGLWTPRTEREGGTRRAADPTIAASYTISRTRILGLALRFTETEYPNVEALIEYMQDNPSTAVDFWPDVDVAGTLYGALLISPMQGFDPQRNPSFTSDYELFVEVIRSSGASWGAQLYYPD